MSDLKAVEKAISKAKILMMQHNGCVFLSTVCCSLPVRITDQVAFAATNGKEIIVNPTTFMALSPQERIFIIAHETLHVVYKHILRQGERDAQLFNMAADYVINSELKEMGLTMPEIGLYDAQYDGLATEQVYKLLEQNPPCEKDRQHALDGDIQEAEGTLEELEALSQQIQDTIVRAVQMAEMKGQGASIPKAVKRALEDMHKPVISWKTILKRFMQEVDRSDYSWSRPNKRYRDMYLPHLKGQDMSKLTFAIDTSGSVSPSEFEQFVSEVAGVFKTIKPKVLELLQFDHELQAVDQIKSLRDLTRVDFKGHGGTCPEVALDHFSKTNSKALIVLTDGYFYTNGLTKPKRPVVWIIFDNPDFEAPFGKAIHVSFKQELEDVS